MKSRQEIWDRELSYARETRFWKSFAIETKCCAEFLLKEFDRVMLRDELAEGFRVFFAYKYVRMLFGYALENLIKGLLLSGDSQHRYIKDDRITFGNNGHNLVWLLNELGVSISEQQEFYLKAWSISAEWFGKYPFPTNINQVLPEYHPMKSSEALSRRNLRGKRDFIHSDLLHQQIGNHEAEMFANIFEEVHSRYET